MPGTIGKSETWLRGASVHAVAPDAVGETLAHRLGATDGANLGIVYLTESLIDHADRVIAALIETTGIQAWTGAIGYGVIGDGVETLGAPGAAALVGRFPADDFRLIRKAGADPLTPDVQAWARRLGTTVGLVHADPADRGVSDALDQLTKAAQAFLVGGLSTGDPAGSLIGGDGTATAGGLSGVLFAPEVPIVTGLSQGCSPIGPVHTVTACQGAVIATIDDRPALEVFKQDAGDLIARDLTRASGYIFAALPVRGSDTGDYLVRNIVAADPASGRLAIAEPVDPGQPILFTRRDHAAAVRDLDRMLADVMRRLDGRPAKGAVYLCCVARGPHLFGPDSDEVRQVQAALGPDVPVIGFFANGEIAHTRLYGYTGVLTVFA